MRKVFLEDLPRWENGFPVKEGTINWRKSINYNIKFIYDNIKGKIKIIDYDGKYLYIKYLDKDIFKITTGSFRSCLFGELLKEELYSYNYDKNKKRQVDLRNLPIKYSGIDWNKVKENKIKIPFIYNNIVGEVSIIDYDGKYLFIKYLDNKPFKILTSNFKKCLLGNLLGEKTNKYRYNINDIIETKMQKIKILKQIRIKNKNNEETHKGYKYKCLKCGNIDIISEYHLKEKKGCSVCGHNKILKGYNDMWATNPKLAKLLANPDDGHKYSEHSNKKIDWKCSDCGNIIKNKSIYNINKKGLSCKKCSDKVSIPEKIMFNVLEQLKIDFIYQLSKQNFKWCNKYYYDFYFRLNNESYIIETNGKQHYEKGFQTIKKARTLEEEKNNDKLKKELALNNGIKEENYIVIDCRKSEFDFIKDNIINCRLNEIFDLSKIDWEECFKYTCSSLIKRACDLWNNEMKNTENIANIMKLNRHTIIKYLKQGNKIDLCEYNSKEEMRKNGKLQGESKGKPIKVFKNGIPCGIFESGKILSIQSEKIFGIKLDKSKISAVCNKERKHHQGFTFEFASKEEYLQYMKDKEENKGKNKEDKNTIKAS